MWRTARSGTGKENSSAALDVVLRFSPVGRVVTSAGTIDHKAIVSHLDTSPVSSTNPGSDVLYCEFLAGISS